MTRRNECPNCGKPSIEMTEPFCSKRCADVDLSRWFRGDYSVPVISDETIPDGGTQEELQSLQP